MQFYCIGGGGGGPKTSQYLVWSPFASRSTTHLLRTSPVFKKQHFPPSCPIIQAYIWSVSLLCILLISLACQRRCAHLAGRSDFKQLWKHSYERDPQAYMEHIMIWGYYRHERVTSFFLVVFTKVYGHLTTEAHMQMHGNEWALNKWKTNKQVQGNSNKHENSNLRIIGYRMASAVCRWLVRPLSLAVCGKRWDFPIVPILML